MIETLTSLIIGPRRKDMNSSELYSRVIVGIIWFLAPLLIFAFSYKANKNMGSSVKWRPHSFVYAVVWSVLVVLLMGSWFIVNRKAGKLDWIILSFLFALLIGSCILWLFAYNKEKRLGISVFIMILFLLVVTIPLLYKVNIYASIMICPLLVWSVFQTCVNCAEVSYESEDIL